MEADKEFIKKLHLPSSCMGNSIIFLDADKVMDKFFKYLNNKMKDHYGDEHTERTLISRKQLKTTLCHYGICKKNTASIIDTMSQKGYIKTVNKRKVELL